MIFTRSRSPVRIRCRGPKMPGPKKGARPRVPVLRRTLVSLTSFPLRLPTDHIRVSLITIVADGCIYDNCRDPRSKKHPNSPYCAKHACSVKDCNKPRDGPGLCCKKHTCHNRNCINCVKGESSSHHSSGPRRYCHGHQVCEVEECEQFVFLDASNRAAKYCFRHYCAPSPGCGGQRVEGEGALGCRDHTCALYPSCTNPRADPIRGLFCEDHECTEAGCRKQKYDSGGVTGVGARTGIWCADHMCMAALTRREDCVNRREGTATNPLYCADHELCEEVECNNFRAVRGRNVMQTRCEEHLLSKCAFPTCPLDAENGAASCRYHTCRAGGCLATLSTNPSASTSLFCDAHRCSEPGCPNPRSTTTTASPPLAGREPSGAYCIEHVYINQLGVGRCRHHRRRHHHGFGGSGGCGSCGWHGGCGCGCGGGCGSGGGDDDDDDSDDDDTDPDPGCGDDGGSGGDSSVGVGVDIGACFHCGGCGDCRNPGKKKRCKCGKC
ncbi:hypothetical protein F5Y06DRAFT_89746 [Hypoxylon sp. FL0890]|nr:hypothetical protein F5Y06DRAFT_89746 [Hypoxylon sp. FL0890]